MPPPLVLCVGVGVGVGVGAGVGVGVTDELLDELPVEEAPVLEELVDPVLELELELDVAAGFDTFLGGALNAGTAVAEWSAVTEADWTATDVAGASEPVGADGAVEDFVAIPIPKAAANGTTAAAARMPTRLPPAPLVAPKSLPTAALLSIRGPPQKTLGEIIVTPVSRRRRRRAQIIRSRTAIATACERLLTPSLVTTSWRIVLIVRSE